MKSLQFKHVLLFIQDSMESTPAASVICQNKPNISSIVEYHFGKGDKIVKQKQLMDCAQAHRGNSFTESRWKKNKKSMDS